MRSLTGLVFLFAGCAGVTTVPLGAPTQLPSGAPQGECEREGFLELTPARGFASGSHETPAGYGVTQVTTVESTAEGVALYRPGGDEALPLVEILPGLAEPALSDGHLRRIAPILKKEQKRKAWFKVSLVGAGISLLGAGALITASSLELDEAVKEPVQLAGASAALGGVTFQMIATLISIAYRPTAQEQTFAGLRGYLLLPGEDDLQAAERGVERHNAEVRERCKR
jgi:hypothetical protein